MLDGLGGRRRTSPTAEEPAEKEGSTSPAPLNPFMGVTAVVVTVRAVVEVLPLNPFLGVTAVVVTVRAVVEVRGGLRSEVAGAAVVEFGPESMGAAAAAAAIVFSRSTKTR